LVEKVENKHKIDLFANLLSSEDKELIITRREYHLQNASSNTNPDIKIPTITKKVEEIKPKKLMDLGNFKNIVMDDTT